MSKKHHSKKHHSTEDHEDHSEKHRRRKHKEKASNQLLNSNDVSDISDIIMKNTDSNSANSEDFDDSTKKHRKHKKHKKHRKHKKHEKKEKFTENYNSGNNYNECLKNEFSEDYYDKSVDDNYPYDSCNKYSDDDTFLNLYDKSVDNDYPDDGCNKCEDDDTSLNLYDKSVDNDYPDDGRNKCMYNDTSLNLYDKSVDNDYPDDGRNKCMYDDTSLNLYDKSVDDDYNEDNCIEIYRDKFNKHYKSRKHYKLCKCKDKKYTSKETIVKCCEVSVKSETLPLCPNTPQTPSTICKPAVIKVPVVLSEPKVTISIISSIKLQYHALEIKRIRKNVYLTQCKIIPNSGDGNPDVGIIFISGFIRKNIEYTTKSCSNKNALCGNIKHTTVKVPFNCTTRIIFLNRPIFIENSSQNEVEMSRSFIKTCDPDENTILGGTLCEQNLKFTEFFKEEIFCELVKSEIVECDIFENPTKSEYQTPINHMFKDIKEKIVMNLTIKILQNQQLKIP